ncbi:MAG: AI-2E family transporter [Aggregatilineales bacterium]
MDTESSIIAPPPDNEDSLRPIPEYQPQWDRPTRIIVLVFMTLAGVAALTLIAPVLQMLIFAFITAFVMYAPVNFFYRNSPLAWGGAVGFMYSVLIIVVIVIVLAFIPALLRGINSLVVTVGSTYSDLQIRLEDYDPELHGMVELPLIGFVDLNPVIEPVKDIIINLDPPAIVEDAASDLPIEPIPGLDAEETEAIGLPSPPDDINIQEIAQNLFNIAGALTLTLTSAIGSVTGLLTTIFLAVFVSALLLLEVPDSDEIMEGWIPEVYHEEIAILLRRIMHVWNGFFRGQVAIGLIIGVLTWLQLRLMGVPFAEVLAVIVGIISLIPTIGGIIALVPLSLVPLFQGSNAAMFADTSNFVVALLVIVINLVMSQVIWNVIAPKILGDALALPVPVIIVGVFIGAAAGGALGAFLVAPIMGTVRVIVLYLIRKLGRQNPFPEETGKMLHSHESYYH